VGQGGAESESTETTHDWTAGVRRERQLDGLLYVLLSALLAGYVLLRLDLATKAGRFGLAVAILVVVLLAARLTGGPGGHRAVVLYRVRHAIRGRVDPGPVWRAAADQRAEWESWQGSVAWLYLLFPVLVLPSARWHEPAAAVPGTILLVAGSIGIFVWSRHLAASSRRWLDDPAGPLRASYTPPRDQRPWTISARQRAFLVVLMIATAAAVLGAFQSIV
jgi:hypothetical protein